MDFAICDTQGFLKRTEIFLVSEQPHAVEVANPCFFPFCNTQCPARKTSRTWTTTSILVFQNCFGKEQIWIGTIL
jgi:hypothetical protein